MHRSRIRIHLTYIYIPRAHTRTHISCSGQPALKNKTHGTEVYRVKYQGGITQFTPCSRDSLSEHTTLAHQSHLEVSVIMITSCITTHALLFLLKQHIRMNINIYIYIYMYIFPLDSTKIHHLF